MEDTKPLNSTHNIGLLKRMLLYFNVTALKVAKAMPTASITLITIIRGD